MAYDPQQRRRALQAFLDTFNISARKLSSAAKLSPSAAAQFLSGKSRSLTDETYELFADGASQILGWRVPTALLRGEADYAIPLHGMSFTAPVSQKGGKSFFDFIIYWDKIIAWLPRFPSLEGRYNLFGIYAIGPEMAPWRAVNDVIYAEKDRRPKVGDYTIVEKKSASLTFIGQVIERDMNGLTLLRFAEGGTRAEFRIPRGDIYTVHRVIDWPEIAFGEDQGAIKWTERPPF